MTDDPLDELLARADALQAEDRWDAEGVALYRAILAKAHRHVSAAVGLGRCYEAIGERELSQKAYEYALKIDPDHQVARSRLERLKRPGKVVPTRTTKSPTARRRTPEEIVDGCLPEPVRGAALRFCAASIRLGMHIDPQRQTVNDIRDQNRFRVIGGVFSGVTVWQSELFVSVDRRALDGRLLTDLETIGGGQREREGSLECKSKRLPHTIVVGVPLAYVDQFHDRLIEPHRRHLQASINAGPPTHAHEHDPALMRYLLSEGEPGPRGTSTTLR